ncbi:DNA invertase Pin-like site-specific DNA recombinase [Martelella mangrovi]|uniref:DNA invertase Pin-like site-specific DNA recombinase n=1 Tax=Martelella mangrovi TaxID=1397477 RepID=A0ABV2ICH2_9HYPH
MNQILKNDMHPPTALIYCRVSTTRQRLEGSGLDSQEQRCRAYAQERGYPVEMVFPDDASGGGDFMQRPGMRAMLAYLDAQKGKRYVVIFDDLKRFARDTEFHIKLRREFAARGAHVECLNFKLEDTPEGIFIETVIAAQGQLEREQNRRQVVQKMRSRVESGFWVFRAPVGYKYVSSSQSGGKVLVPDEPLASLIREVLEGYASGRFASQAEVQRYLERDPFFPKDKKDGALRPMTVSRLLRKVVYAGYVEAPKWNIGLHKGQHEGLISFETHQRILDHLDGKKRPAARKDFSEDFPLRGFVLCDDCGEPMTAAWSKGCRNHYAYYRCKTKGCASHGKSVPRAEMEKAFSDVLRTLQPNRQLFQLVTAMMRDAWDMRLAQAKARKDELQSQIGHTEDQMENLLDRIVETTNPTVIAAYEARITKLEREKIVLSERASKMLPPKGRLEEMIELSLKFLSSPWNIYKNGSFIVKQTVLRLAFAEPLKYSRGGSRLNYEKSFPFKMLTDFFGLNDEMVHQIAFERPFSGIDHRKRAAGRICRGQRRHDHHRQAGGVGDGLGGVERLAAADPGNDIGPFRGHALANAFDFLIRAFAVERFHGDFRLVIGFDGIAHQRHHALVDDRKCEIAETGDFRIELADCIGTLDITSGKNGC